MNEPQTGTLKFPDGTQVEWTFVEYLPYEPSAYQTEAGIIVASTTTEYFISVDTGDVYGQADEGESLTRLLEGVQCPEIQTRIDAFEAAMESRWEERYLG